MVLVHRALRIGAVSAGADDLRARHPRPDAHLADGGRRGHKARKPTRHDGQDDRDETTSDQQHEEGDLAQTARSRLLNRTELRLPLSSAHIKQTYMSSKHIWHAQRRGA